ncbi:hypothetical protein [Dyadobacter bucti]|jgi:ABC-type transporter Mla subunit MlaD|uniref:hypothetical protein n=1 Tax=Dyadobacter bucti TaxID=2572203 RepID=UPI00110995CC|nr:hypothetical protein [Dyadobacter bucti]
MKTSILSLIICLVTLHARSQAIETLNKVNQGAATLNQGANTLNNTSAAANNTANAVGNSFRTIKGLIPDKKNKEKEMTEAVTATTSNILVTIVNVDYSKLKEVEEHVKSVSKVKNTSKKFSSASSTISVEYTGQADELWDALPETIRNMYDLKELGDGVISLEAKK